MTRETDGFWDHYRYLISKNTYPEEYILLGFVVGFFAGAIGGRLFLESADTLWNPNAETFTKVSVVGGSTMAIIAMPFISVSIKNFYASHIDKVEDPDIRYSKSCVFHTALRGACVAGVFASSLFKLDQVIQLSM